MSDAPSVDEKSATYDPCPASRDDAIAAVLTAKGGPMSAPEVRQAIEDRWPGSWPYATWLDIHDDLTNMFGRPAR